MDVMGTTLTTGVHIQHTHVYCVNGIMLEIILQALTNDALEHLYRV